MKVKVMGLNSSYLLKSFLLDMKSQSQGNKVTLYYRLDPYWDFEASVNRWKGKKAAQTMCIKHGIQQPQRLLWSWFRFQGLLWVNCWLGLLGFVRILLGGDLGELIWVCVCVYNDCTLSKNCTKVNLNNIK